MSQDVSDTDLPSAEHRIDSGLPPVEPPSPGFIVQLFVVPALIVLAVVGVWALFGKIASSEEDWRELVEDIRNTNEHRRWRGANGLATLLLRDQQLADSGQHLASNPEIARVLVQLFEEGLKSHSQREDDLKQEAFLARTLGLLDSPGQVLPALEHGMKADQDREIRKNSIASIAVIAGRANEQHKSIESPALIEDLIAATSDSDSLIRDAGTFALGLIPSPASRERLTVVLTGTDANARVNAAVGLARQKSTAGWPVFLQVLTEASGSVGSSTTSRPVESLLAVKNTLHAVRVLADEWTPAQRTELTTLIAPISQNDAEPRIRIDAADALIALRRN